MDDTDSEIDSIKGNQGKVQATGAIGLKKKVERLTECSDRDLL